MNSNLMKTLRVTATAAMIVGSVLALHVARAQQAGIKRTDLQRHDLSAPGWEAIQVRVDIEPGMAFPKHTHPGEEIIYVLKGSLEYEVEGKPPATLKAGDVLFIPAGTIHAAKNVGSDTASELATYVVEKGKPLVNLVK
jgi:quercetin dioxygenase-like cupin family protein